MECQKVNLAVFRLKKGQRIEGGMCKKQAMLFLLKLFSFFLRLLFVKDIYRYMIFLNVQFVLQISTEKRTFSFLQLFRCVLARWTISHEIPQFRYFVAHT